MKRVNSDTHDDDNCILSLLLSERTPRALQLHVLSYAYRSAGSLAPTCRALNGIVRERAFWRYGCTRELRAILCAQKWPADVIALFCERIDPLFVAWPKSMPGMKLPCWGDTLEWIWDEQCIQFEVYKDSYHVRLCGSGTLHVYQFGWSSVLRMWTIFNYWRLVDSTDADGAWQAGQGVTSHACRFREGQPVAYECQLVVPVAVAPLQVEAYWMSVYMEHCGMRYEGLCTPNYEPRPPEYGGRWILEN